MSIKEMKYEELSFIESEKERSLVVQIMEALNNLCLVEWMRDNTEGLFMGEPKIQMIMIQEYLQENYPMEFTPQEFASAICMVESIVHNGFEEFKEKYILYQKEQFEYIKLPRRPDFSFIQDESDRKMISRGYDKLFEIEGWETLRNFKEESFMFSKSPEVNRIMMEIDSTYGHSGSSLAYLMRIFEYIAKEGFDTYREKVLN